MKLSPWERFFTAYLKIHSVIMILVHNTVNKSSFRASEYVSV